MPIEFRMPFWLQIATSGEATGATINEGAYSPSAMWEGDVGVTCPATLFGRHRPLDPWSAGEIPTHSGAVSHVLQPLNMHARVSCAARCRTTPDPRQVRKAGYFRRAAS